VGVERQRADRKEKEGKSRRRKRRSRAKEPLEEDDHV
jgi:hypothetical protein